MSLIGSAQGMVGLGLSFAVLVMTGFAFFDVLRRRPEDFVRADKRTKNIWLAVTGVALLLGFLTLGNVLSFFTVIAVVAAGVYLADVRPALNALGGQGGRGRNT